MLQRDHRIRTQVHQIADALVFAVSFWLAYALRANDPLAAWLGLDALGLEMFTRVQWLLFVLVPAAPLVLESQGFYQQPVAGSRATIFWPLLKSCTILTLGMVLLVFMVKEVAPRGVPVFFGVISFSLMWIKGEVIRLVLRHSLTKGQFKRRIILAGNASEIARLRRMVPTDSLEVTAEFNLAEASTPHLIELLHEHSVSGVLISAKHAQLDRVETIIKLCEIEGVEAWLVADFFATQIAQASR